MTDDTADAFEPLGEDLELDDESAEQVKGGLRFEAKAEANHKHTGNFIIR